MLSENILVTDNSLSTLTNLTKLKLFYNDTITDKSLSALTNLKSLDLCENFILQILLCRY